MADTTIPGSKRKAISRPQKPYPTYPLSAHASGKWVKKIRGEFHYFGRWAKRDGGKLVRVPDDGWRDALAEYLKVADDLHAGRTPRAESDGLTVRQLCNAFDQSKRRQLEAGELSQRSYADYVEATDLIVEAFGRERLVDDLRAEDFAKLRARMARTWGPVRLGNGITRIRSVFKYGVDNGLTDRAVRFGTEFRKPGKAVLRRHKATSGPNMLEADEIRKLIDAAGVPLRAMVLLGVNAGFGPMDLATLPLAALDLEAGFVTFPRPKTGIARRAHLWPETVAALREAIEARPEPKQPEHAGLAFITARGNQWVSGGAAHPVTASIVPLMKAAGVHRAGLGPYTLRHVFRTVADEVRDRPAVDLVMGHQDPSVAAHYRERIDDSRLVEVAEHVRAWVFVKEGRADGN